MMDMSGQYNTQLSPEEEAAFLQWQKENPRLGNTFDYDARGFFKAGASAAENGHGSDKFKKPNHPTFSNESMYHGVDGHEGGAWMQQGDGTYIFTPGKTNLDVYGPLNLQEYFNKAEPKNRLVLPEDE